MKTLAVLLLFAGAAVAQQDVKNYIAVTPRPGSWTGPAITVTLAGGQILQGGYGLFGDAPLSSIFINRNQMAPTRLLFHMPWTWTQPAITVTLAGGQVLQGGYGMSGEWHATEVSYQIPTNAVTTSNLSSGAVRVEQ